MKSFDDAVRRIAVLKQEKSQSYANSSYWSAHRIANLYGISYHTALKNLKLAGGSIRDDVYRVLSNKYIEMFGEPNTK